MNNIYFKEIDIYRTTVSTDIIIQKTSPPSTNAAAVLLSIGKRRKYFEFESS